MNQLKWWQALLLAIVICVFFISMMTGLHLEQVEKTKRDIERTQQMREETEQLRLKQKKE